jgi:outer membrane protein OmpA-like peptidoglycan-associated protein
MSEREQKLKQSESSVAARQKTESAEAHRTDLPSRVAPSGLAALPNRLWQAGNRAINRLLSRRDGGQPLAPQTRAEMERSFNADFSEVRIHDDATARAGADEIGAEAFTHGDDIYLADGASSPRTVEGKSLLAHELAHVVQQRRASGRQSSLISEPGDRFEADADQAAASVGAARPVQVTATGAPPSVQRQPAEAGLGEKALDFILEQGIKYTDEGWKIGGVSIKDVEKIGAAAKTAASIFAKVLKGDIAGALEIVNPKNPEEEKKALEKLRRIKEEVDSLQDADVRAKEKEESRRREAEAVRKEGERFRPDPKSEFEAPKLGEGLRGGIITHVLLDEFDLDKSQLKSKHHRKLNDLAAQVMADPAAEIEIIGHTDSSGPDNFNKKLSDARAKAVLDYLIKRGVAAGKIKLVTGKGATEPFVEEKTEADRAQNRRVEIFYKPSVVKEKFPGFGAKKLRLDK